MNCNSLMKQMMLPLDADKYDCVDYAKLLMAVFVVACHTYPEQSLLQEWLRSSLSQLWLMAVPLFFVFSGFLLWRKAKSLPKSEQLARIKKFMSHSLKLYIIWTAIYLPYTIYGFYLDGVSAMKSIAIFVVNLFFVGQNYFSWQLWYMHGMIVAGVILFALVKLNCRLRMRCIVAVVLGLLGIIVDNIIGHDVGTKAFGYFYYIFLTTNNGLYMGFPFIMMGVFIAEKGVVRSHWFCVLLLLTGIGVYMTGQTFLAKMITVFAIVQMLFKMPASFNSGRVVAEKCRFASTVIYFVHMVWVGILTFVFTVDSHLLKFLLAVILSSIIAFWAVAKQNSKLVKMLFG